MYWSGAGRLYEIAMRPGGAIVLMYHSVPDADAAAFVDPENRVAPELFEQQIEYLRAHRRVVPFSSLVDQIAAGECPPAGTVCVTFDDGYLDNLTTAAPILAKYEIPATLFLATGYVERGEPQWSDALHCSIAYRTRDRLSIPSVGLEAANLSAGAALEEARARLHRHLLASDHGERARLLVEIADQLAPSVSPPRLTLNWDDVRELRQRYPFFEIGGHTRDHVDLRGRDGASARAEIEACAADLRRELRCQPEHFAFPYERWSAAVRDIVIDCGWRSALGMGTGYRITASSDRYAIPRVETPRSMTALRFKTSGAYPGALSMLGLG